MPEINKFFERFLKLRKDNDLSQEELALKLGFNGNAQISRFENGTGLPTFETLLLIANTFKVDLHWLVTGQSSPSVERAITLLYPFFSGFLDQINENVKTLEKEREELLEAARLDPGPPITIYKVQSAFRFEEIQDEIESHHLYYAQVQKTIKENLAACRNPYAHPENTPKIPHKKH